MAASWSESEPGYFVLRSEVSRLAARARGRKLVVLVMSLGAAAVAALMTLQSPRNYEAQVSIRVTEVVEFRMPRSNWTDLELRSFITDVAFTTRVLRAVYDRHFKHKDPGGNPQRGVERLRDSLDVTVARNRIVAQLEEGKPTPKSAYVVLRFSDPTAETAQGVLEMLQKPIIEISSSRRRKEAADDIQRATLLLEEARKTLAALNKQALALASRPLRGTDISPVRLMELTDSIAETQRMVARLEQEKVDAERRARQEKARPGINFAVASEDMQEPLPLAPLLSVVTILAFFLSLPISVLVVGAFDPFLQSLEDIRRLGIPALGRLRNIGET
jgi:hypothetical protein